LLCKSDIFSATQVLPSGFNLKSKKPEPGLQARGPSAA
jgi:hypothetical protein